MPNEGMLSDSGRFFSTASLEETHAVDTRKGQSRSCKIFTGHT